MVDPTRVLVVEDDPELRTYLTRCLDSGSTPVTVTEVRDGQEAWSELHHGGADVVITDILMGGSNGLELCRRLDQEDPSGRLPVLIISGDDEALAQARLYAATRSHRAVLEKPFNATLLLNALGRLLRDTGR